MSSHMKMVSTIHIFEANRSPFLVSFVSCIMYLVYKKHDQSITSTATNMPIEKSGRILKPPAAKNFTEWTNKLTKLIMLSMPRVISPHLMGKHMQQWVTLDTWCDSSLLYPPSMRCCYSGSCIFFGIVSFFKFILYIYFILYCF